MSNSKRKRKKRRDTLVLKLLILVAVVLVVFEGRLVVTMVQHRSSMNDSSVTNPAAAVTANGGTITESTESNDSAAASLPSTPFGSVLAGLSTASSGSSSGAAQTAETEAPHATVSNPDSPAIVPETDPPVDDSYFSDAAFIGDSRMEGFRNASGITQGRFFTSVGMSLASMQTGEVIATSEGNITVAAALSGGKYSKIYIMLGANDLGEYDWDAFREGFVSCTSRFLEIQPDAILYICSVIYVEESKVTTGDYVNNTNVDKINSILLDVCEEQGYHYIDLNEILSNGYGSLIEGASSDGVHIYENYCKMMLDYLKSHYIPVEKVEDTTEEETEKETRETADDEAEDSV